MKKYISIFIGITALVSCGTKISNNPEAYKNQVEADIDKINADKTLRTDHITGALTDQEGFKDIGTFQYTVFFDGNTTDLKKIHNVEITNRTFEESYYFKNNQLIYFESVSENTNPKKVYSYNDKVISSENTNPNEQELFVSKAKRFLKAFQESHR